VCLGNELQSLKRRLSVNVVPMLLETLLYESLVFIRELCPESGETEKGQNHKKEMKDGKSGQRLVK
jgi:hypothetical protein